MKKLISCLLVLVLVLSFVACSGSQKGNEEAPKTETKTEVTTVKIAVITALSGGASENGTYELNAAKLAAKNINAAGGIKSLGGAQIEIVSYDYTSDTNNTKSGVEKILSENDIVAGIGGATSGLVLPTLPVWEANEIPLVTENNSNDLTNQGYEYIFSVHCRGSQVGEVSVNFIQWLQSQGQNLTKAAIIYENSAKGSSSADGARAYCQKAGLEIVYDESHPNTITDVTSIVTAVKAAGADVCFIYTLDQVSRLLTTSMQDLNYNPVAITSNWNPSFYEALGDKTNGIIANANWLPTNKAVQDNPEYVELCKQYKEEYNISIEQCAGGAYSSVMVIAQALEKCGSTDGPTLMKTIAEGEWKVLLGEGTITFNEAHEAQGPVPVIGQWQDGQVVTIFPRELASGDFKTY